MVFCKLKVGLSAHVAPVVCLAVSSPGWAQAVNNATVTGRFDTRSLDYSGESGYAADDRVLTIRQDQAGKASFDI
ncbi:MAG TPA: hypothetical protein VGL95_07465 [Acetobacteraceae bacterium]|jgi:hypothetical protein